MSNDRSDRAPAPVQQPRGKVNDQTPAATTPKTPPNSSQPGTQLPTITVSAKRKPPPKPPAAARATGAGQATTAAAPTAPSPYEPGAPNVAGGAAVVPQFASQMTISGEDLNARPVMHSTEILEAAPGLAVVEHSGSGKANQYYLRGYDLDHGTDMATFWDDVPINLPTNAHGQGYTDLNFLIPETVS